MMDKQAMMQAMVGQGGGQPMPQQAAPPQPTPEMIEQAVQILQAAGMLGAPSQDQQPMPMPQQPGQMPPQ